MLPPKFHLLIRTQYHRCYHVLQLLLTWIELFVIELFVVNMNSNLTTLLSATEDVDLPDRNLFETDLPQLIGEVSQNFEKGLSHDSKKEDIDDCLKSMVVCCNAQTGPHIAGGPGGEGGGQLPPPGKLIFFPNIVFD